MQYMLVCHQQRGSAGAHEQNNVSLVVDILSKSCSAISISSGGSDSYIKALTVNALRTAVFTQAYRHTEH